MSSSRRDPVTVTVLCFNAPANAWLSRWAVMKYAKVVGEQDRHPLPLPSVRFASAVKPDARILHYRQEPLLSMMVIIRVIPAQLG